MTKLTFHDMVQLSSSLDGQLSQAEITRLNTRIQADPALASALLELRQTRALLRQTPKRRIPRNFTLTPTMAGIRPPIPRLVPAFSWASAMAMLFFLFTLGTNLLGRLSFGAATPLMAAAPMTSEGYGYGGGPVATQPLLTDNMQGTPTSEPSQLIAPDATSSEATRLVSPVTPPATKTPIKPVNFWLYLWLGLAVILIIVATLIRLASVRAFHRKAGGKQNKNYPDRR
jgi:hypothetical protein